jgi:hypothetical protein
VTQPDGRSVLMKSDWSAASGRYGIILVAELSAPDSTAIAEQLDPTHNVEGDLRNVGCT